MTISEIFAEEKKEMKKFKGHCTRKDHLSK
jgi:hypothetical protein